MYVYLADTKRLLEKLRFIRVGYKHVKDITGTYTIHKPSPKKKQPAIYHFRYR